MTMERSSHHLASKVAQVTAMFWLLKIIATTLGETFGDFISQTLNLGYVVGLSITGPSLRQRCRPLSSATAAQMFPSYGPAATIELELPVA